jgi:hypothetical protein
MWLCAAGSIEKLQGVVNNGNSTLEGRDLTV